MYCIRETWARVLECTRILCAAVFATSDCLCYEFLWWLCRIVAEICIMHRSMASEIRLH
jgi:hypothetical protein